MFEIIRIPPLDSARLGNLFFEIKFETPRESTRETSLLQRDVMELLREESERVLNSERVLKSDHGVDFDSVAFFMGLYRITNEKLAMMIIESDARVANIKWTAQKGTLVVPRDDISGKYGTESTVCDCKLQPSMTIVQAESCAKTIVDIYHARYCEGKKDDFEHSNALLPRKNVDGRERTDLELQVLSECNKKIDREIENLEKRSGACKEHLLNVVEKYRLSKISQRLPLESCIDWYVSVGLCIKNVASTTIGHRHLPYLTEEQKASQLHYMYPKGWFDVHIFPHVEVVHEDNEGSAPEEIRHMTGANDRNRQEQPQIRNKYNSNQVAKARQSLTEYRDKTERSRLEEKVISLRREGVQIRRINELQKQLDERSSTNGSTSVEMNTTPEKVTLQGALPVQNPVHSDGQIEILKEGNILDAPKKGLSQGKGRPKVTKTRPKRVHRGDNENIYQREYRNTKRR